MKLSIIDPLNRLQVDRDRIFYLLVDGLDECKSLSGFLLKPNFHSPNSLLFGGLEGWWCIITRVIERKCPDLKCYHYYIPLYTTVTDRIWRYNGLRCTSIIYVSNWTISEIEIYYEPLPYNYRLYSSTLLYSFCWIAQWICPHVWRVFHVFSMCFPVHHVIPVVHYFSFVSPQLMMV